MMRLFICLVVSILLATACGSGPATEVASSADAEDAPQSFEDLEYQSPIADFLGQDINRFDFDEAAMMEQQRDAERAIAACMSEKGFEYIPQDVSQMMSFGGPPNEEFEPGSDEWINKYGFGISTQRFPQSMVGDLVGMDDAGFMGPDEEFVDPNADYVEGLSEGERQAYYEALHGQPPDFGPEGPDEDFVFEPSGCQFESFRNGPGGGNENIRDFYQAFGDDLQTLQERVMADSRVVAFNTEISACVAEAGMTWTSIQDVYEQFEPRMRELEPQAFRAGVDPFEEAGLDPETMTDRERDEFFMELNRLSPAQLEILAEVQADEIALAKEVIACGGGPFNEQKIMNEVRVEYEQAFLDENADAIAEFAPDN